jgi:ABC-2 type transport system ATP-binding protein
MSYFALSKGNLIQVRDLKKKYSALTAVDGVSFSIPKGCCFGLLGPNGAGKTTLIEIIEDIISATSGEIFYKGRPRSANFREEVGIMFQQTALLAFLSVREILKTFASLYHDPADVDQLMVQCHLENIQSRMNDQISGGQKQRLLLALALVNKPELLFLDEPSTGLDPQARQNLWKIVESIKAQNKTIILTTHYMEEAQNLCDQIVIMDQGRIIAMGTPDELIRAHCKGVTITLPELNNHPSLHSMAAVISTHNGHIKLRTDNVTKTLSDLIEAKVDLSEMSVRSPNLEDVFLTLTGKTLRD